MIRLYLQTAMVAFGFVLCIDGLAMSLRTLAAVMSVRVEQAGWTSPNRPAGASWVCTDRGCWCY
jgi:hypothetical protein